MVVVRSSCGQQGKADWRRLPEATRVLATLACSTTAENLALFSLSFHAFPCIFFYKEIGTPVDRLAGRLTRQTNLFGFSWPSKVTKQPRTSCFQKRECVHDFLPETKNVKRSCSLDPFSCSCSSVQQYPVKNLATANWFIRKIGSDSAASSRCHYNHAWNAPWNFCMHVTNARITSIRWHSLSEKRQKLECDI